MQTLYNTLTRQKEALKPIEPGKVSMYVCGPTVYDFFHIGNARTFSVFDMVYRWLTASGYAVNYARNVTDIDDKIIERANENGESIGVLTDRMTAAMHEDFDRLKLLRPTAEPRATQHVAGMLDIIKMLEDKGIAYRAPNGDVYYAVRKFAGYGKLSRKNPDDLIAGERVAVDTNKRDPLDFALWKSAKPHEPHWPSIFGNGRPGWHIECSAMCKAVLGEKLDIHGGGWDLQFPHHENEIAQSEGALGHPFVNVWMHAAFLNFDSEKMSKSLGNFFTIREVLNKLNPVRGGEEVRFFLLRGHYRSEINYTYDTLMDAANSLMGIYRVLKDVPPIDGFVLDWSQPLAAKFKAAMEDDFDTPAAFAVLFELRDEVRKTGDAALAALLKALGGTIGLLQANPDAFISGAEANNDVQSLIDERNTAKKSRDFSLADAIRKQLDAMGIVLEDKPGGVTEWRKK
ncbi:MAG: cysteine--tRNA ligase [Betaproteobacteria bacterium]|nr:cysteine--tRNA ligase [Betaproteobacteria bacterium]